MRATDTEVPVNFLDMQERGKEHIGLIESQIAQRPQS